MIHQDLSDFFGLEDGRYGRSILNNSKTKIILNLEPDEAEYVKDVLKLTRTEIRSITQFERGEALISSNSNKVPVIIKASREEQQMITTDRAELEQAIHDEGVTSSVLLLGVREDINRLYSMLDVFFMPSLYEGLPVSCVEAQASGLPCVYSTDVPHESDITQTGLFVDRTADISQWVTALEQAMNGGRLTGNPEVLSARGYSASANAEQLMRYYEQLMAMGR